MTLKQVRRSARHGMDVVSRMTASFNHGHCSSSHSYSAHSLGQQQQQHQQATRCVQSAQTPPRPLHSQRTALAPSVVTSHVNESRKVIVHADQHQNLIISRGSTLARVVPMVLGRHPYIRKFSCSQNDRQIDRQTDRQTNKQTNRLKQHQSHIAPLWRNNKRLESIMPPAQHRPRHGLLY